MFLLLIFLISPSLALMQTLKEPTCTTQGTIRTTKLSMNSTRHPTGDWIDNLSGWTDYSNSSNTTQMEIVHTVTECQGKRVLHIQGVTQVPRHEEAIDRLKFHPRRGKNTAILNKGLTVQKINVEDQFNSIAFTNRPLKDEEIFEVKIERKNTKFYTSLGIGFITQSPEDVEILSEMYKSPIAWLYHDVNLYNNGRSVLKTAGKHTHTLKVGDRVGVMRSEMRILHLFVNGEDQGPLMSNVPHNVYGALDLRGGFEKSSIVY